MEVIHHLFTLPIVQTLRPGVTLRRQDELDIMVIDTAFCRAAIALQGAHLLTWQPVSQPNPVLWLSENTPFKTGVPIRGGVPLCWPWFTDLGGEPFHGFARILPWQVASLEESEQALTVTLILTDSEQSRYWWPHAFHLTFTCTLTAEHCALSLSAAGDFSTTAALHSYLYTPDINGVSIIGTGSSGYDTVAGKPITLAKLPLTITQETGIIFSAPDAESVVQDNLAEREIRICHNANSNIVVWNPWQARSTAISDMPDDGYRTFVCVETACIDRPLVSRDQHPVSFGVQFSVSAPGTHAGGVE